MFEVALLESICVDLRQIRDWGQRPIGTSQRLAALLSAKTIRRFLLPRLKRQVRGAIKHAESEAEREELVNMITLELLLTYEEWRKAWCLMQILGVEDGIFASCPE